MSSDADHAEALCDAVRHAFEQGRPLRIAGSGSKSFLTEASDGSAPAGKAALLSVADHQGVIDYRPEELVITVRAGTPLREVARVLTQANQHLPFEPPRFRGGGTIGGAVACGLSGAGRPWRGGVRDVLLGVELINGRGERLRFGGQVMKNVAGYDVARLQAGAFGTLGVLLAVSLKVLPRPPEETTRTFSLSAAEALTRCREWARRPLPITGTCHYQGLLRVRFSGAEPAVREAVAELGGEVEPDAGFWNALRDQRLEFFAGGGLWRASVPPAAPEPLQDCLIGWAGAERWWRPRAEDQPAAMLLRQGGHGRPFDGTFGVRDGPCSSASARTYSARLKEAFDPGGILNAELCVPQETVGAD